jgi:hypothetical protein
MMGKTIKPSRTTPGVPDTALFARRKQAVLDALAHGPRGHGALCGWTGLKASQLTYVLDALVLVGAIHKTSRRHGSPYALGAGPVVAEAGADEPACPVTVTELAPGHRVERFGAGWCAGDGQKPNHPGHGTHPLRSIYA